MQQQKIMMMMTTKSNNRKEISYFFFISVLKVLVRVALLINKADSFFFLLKFLFASFYAN